MCAHASPASREACQLAAASCRQRNSSPARLTAHVLPRPAGLSLYSVDEVQLRAAAPTLILTQTLCAVCAPSLGDLGDIAATCRELESVLGPVSGEAAGEAAVPRVLSLQPNNLVKRLHPPVDFCPNTANGFHSSSLGCGCCGSSNSPF